jgi:hypothetical protein
VDGEVIDRNLDPVPAARGGHTPVGHRLAPAATPARLGQQQPQFVTGEDGEFGAGCISTVNPRWVV